MDSSEYHRIAQAEDHHWWYVSTRRLLRELLVETLQPGIVSLDVGAGPGGNGAWLAQYGPVIALDYEPIALEYVRTRRPELVPLQASAVALPIADHSVDLVLALTVLYHVDDDCTAVNEFARVLRPGGRVLFIEPAFNVLHREHDVLTHGIRRYRTGDLERLAVNAGLQVTRSTYAKSFLFPPAAVIAGSQRIVKRKRASQPPRSDLEARRADRIATPIMRKLAELEHHILRRINLPFGTSAVVVAQRASTGLLQP